MMKSSVLAVLALAASISPTFAQEPVRIGQPNWFAGEVVSKLLARIIGDNMGLPIEIVAGTNPEIFEGINTTGTVDIHPDTWLPNHSGWVMPGLEDGTITLSGSSYSGVDAMCVPRYVSEEYDINSVQDLISDRGREIFDTDGNGRGDIWIGAEGWGSTLVMQVKMRDFGLDQYLDSNLMSEGDFQEVLFAKMAAREPVAFYCYQPHFWFALDYITVLEEPAYDAASYNMVSPGESENWFEESSITTGDLIKDVQVTYATRLEETHPEVAIMLSQFGLSGEDLTELIFMVQVKEYPLDMVLDEWLGRNEIRIDAWIRGQS